MNILVIDVGGNNVKLLATGQTEPRKFPSGPDLTPKRLVAGVLETAQDWAFDAITVGFPAPVIPTGPAREPVNLGHGWLGFDFEQAFGKPVRFINDAAMQALGSYQGGRMLFLGLGTGLGTSLIVDGVIVPMELGHLPYRKATFEEYVGDRGRERLGLKRWQRRVEDVVQRLTAALVPDDVVLGGGNIKKLERLPKGVRLGNNANAFVGGFRVWDDVQRKEKRGKRKA